MMLLTKENRKQLPKLYEQDGKGGDSVAYVKFFTPDSNWTWYATEFDGDDLFFGLVEGFETELGYFRLSELESSRGPLGLAIERDRHFDPTPLHELSDKFSSKTEETADPEPEETIEYLSVTDTAKLIRAALKKAFPGVKFSVRSQSYAGGASIDIRWMDGPTDRQVSEITEQFSGAEFDGMIDMQIYTYSWLLPDGSAVGASSCGTAGSGGVYSGYNYSKPHPDAKKVSFGSDYVFTNRDYSPAFVEMVTAEFHQKSGIDLPEIYISSDGETAGYHILSDYYDPRREYRDYLTDYAAGQGITTDKWDYLEWTDEPEPIQAETVTSKPEPVLSHAAVAVSAASPVQWLDKYPDWYCPID